MRINTQEFYINGISYTIRSALAKDAQVLSEIRLLMDGETENLDREKGEGYIDISGFEQLIKADTENNRNLFLVAELNDEIVGFSRCAGNLLKRSSHKVEFGVCVLKEYWGNGIGKNLLKESIAWADGSGVTKITLNVLETNDKAIELYKKSGFEIEGVLRKDKLLADGKYYNTIIMGRFKE
ncbi:GNAT family N-acetyltransferase [Paenibacillus sp. 19GGS1-52]|uniref:GNAT family N-acetyltransferase n=1 Tax=Paenibacillus sp. 19GGS1-52 TaxID=2758563 RepID=UPI001EFA76DB|nr:GNAT family N-acetyltransferase [Paenibacillus sp. 19GGS1-52]ULO08891.1 GNAT family N-acetyltransferase [Paenibacillus sp. 19GGS1-52]